MPMPSPRFLRIMLFRITGAPADPMPIPPALSSITLPSTSGVPVNANPMAPPEQPMIALPRITGEPRMSLLPELQMIPSPQFTIVLETIVGDPPCEMYMAVVLFSIVNPLNTASGAAPVKATATDPVGALMYVAEGPSKLANRARFAPNCTDSTYTPGSTRTVSNDSMLILSNAD